MEIKSKIIGWDIIYNERDEIQAINITLENGKVMSFKK
jgi:hypothetical protein